MPILDIDVQGVKNVKAWMKKQSTGESSLTSNDLPTLDAKFIFIAPPSLETLRERLEARGTETPESLEKRTRNAGAEMEYGMEGGNFDVTIVNDGLDQACAEFSAAIENLYGDL